MARRLATSVTAALALFVLAASAFASPSRPDDRAGARGLGTGSGITVTSVARPDDRAGLRGLGTSPNISGLVRATRPDDRAGSRTSTPSSAPALAAVVTAATAFQWGDAATGAGVALAAVALAGALMLTARRRTKVSALPSS
jgi:hypothetical protein